MKKKRHIEITAVRRRITVVLGDVPAAASGEQPPKDNNEEVWSTVADLLTTKQANFTYGQLQSSRSPEVRGLIEALAESTGDTAITAKQLGLGPKEFFLKLWFVWGRSLKQFKNRLCNRINDHRRNLKLNIKGCKTTRFSQKGDSP